ncbi:putative uncharacterized protein DDB_G0286901 [Condylostylus longicornis]|uniref:putative uncharacterized protein DDB_G0286901 n=1 Tax=Condylostylus longicornis TaxID=2530218 RepID=UPI00244DBCF7|nr:putative uncharacterized protein DDB_G0286901 [Condylostylus longicornis]
MAAVHSAEEELGDYIGIKEEIVNKYRTQIIITNNKIKETETILAQEVETEVESTKQISYYHVRESVHSAIQETYNNIKIKIYYPRNVNNFDVRNHNISTNNNNFDSGNFRRHSFRQNISNWNRNNTGQSEQYNNRNYNSTFNQNNINRNSTNNSGQYNNSRNNFNNSGQYNMNRNSANNNNRNSNSGQYRRSHSRQDEAMEVDNIQRNSVREDVQSNHVFYKLAPEHLTMIQITINKLKYLALVDTGSTFCIIDNRVLRFKEVEIAPVHYSTMEKIQ